MDDHKRPEKTELNKAIDIVFASLGLRSTPPSEIPGDHDDGCIDPEIAEVHGRLVTVALACWGNREMAHRAVDRAFETWALERSPITLDTHVGRIFSLRTAGYLIKNGICTVRDCLPFSRFSLCTLTGINPKTAIDIENTLQSHGFSLQKTID